MVARANIQNVYVEDENGVVLTNQRPFNSDFEARLVFNGDYVVKAGEVKAFYLVMDVNGSVNELIKMSITDVDATSDVEGLPVVSNVVHTTSYASTTVDFDTSTNAPVANPTNVLYVGDTDKEIMKFSLSNGSNERDVIVKSIRFRNVETIEGKVDNVKLIAGGQTVDATAIVDGKYITFNVNDYVLREGDTKNFYVHADIVGGEQDDKIQLYLDETSDISAIEADTNAATQITNASTNNYGKAYKIAEGDNLITKSSESPASSYIPNDENDVTVLVANVSTSAEMYVEKIRVHKVAGMTATNADLKRVKLYINDKYVDEGTLVGTDYEFSYYGNLKGANKFVVKVDTDKNATDGRTIQVSLDNNSIAFGSNAEYVASRNTVQASEINGSATSAVLTIKKPALESVTRTDGIANIGEKLIAGATDVLVGKYTFQANNVRDLNITDLTFAVNGDTPNITTLKLVVNGNVVDTENVNAASVTFNSVNVNVPRGGTAEVQVLATLTTSYDTTQTFQANLTAVSVEDAKGNTAVNNATLPVNGATFTVVTAATLYVSADSNTPVESVVAANPNTEVEVARFKFKATDDDAQIQELTLVNYPTATNAVNGTVTPDTQADSVVNTVFVYDVNGNKLGQATLTNGAAYFAFANPVNLPKDQDTVLVVKVKTNAINDVNNTNKLVDFAVLENGQTLGTTTKTTKIISKANGVEIPAANATYTNAQANAQIFRKTIITLANDAQTSTTLVAGTNDLYLWSVTADQAGAAKIAKFDLDITKQGATASTYELYINGQKVDATDVTITDNGTDVEVAFAGNYANGYEISAGATVNFKLVATDVAVNSSTDSITVRLNEKGTVIGMFNVAGATPASIVWTDEAADNTLSTDAYWFTDKDLPSLPLNGQTLSAN